MSDESPFDDDPNRQRGERLAAKIPRLELPEERAETIRRAMRSKLTAESGEGQGLDTAPMGPSISPRAYWLVAASLLLLVVAWWGVGGSRVRLLDAADGTGTFEALAISAHESLRHQGAELDLVSDSPTEVRLWLADLGLSADLVSERPEIDAGRFELLGVRRMATGFPAAAVSYRIDGLPATLAVTSANQVPEVPSWSLLGKTVRVSAAPAMGAHVLTWSNAGKAYTLISELPSRGLGACLICHTDSRRRDIVEGLQSEL